MRQKPRGVEGRVTDGASNWGEGKVENPRWLTELWEGGQIKDCTAGERSS